MDDTLFDSLNAAYAQDMFDQYARNPDSVPEAWRSFFADGGARAVAQGLFVPEQMERPGGGAGAWAAPTAVAAAPTSAAPSPAAPGAAAPGYAVPAVGAPAGVEPSDLAERLRRALPVVSRATALVQAFRDHGHQLARIDPLGSEPPGHPQLAPSFFGTTMEELADLPSSLVMDKPKDRSVADALQELREIYAGSIGYEFEHVDDHIKVEWLWDQVERGAHFTPMSAAQRRALLERLTQVEGLEQFLHRAYLGQKRFSLEGLDMMVPMLDLTLEEAVRAGAREAVLGMAHRGRLNVLTHVVGVSYAELLAEFEGPTQLDSQLHVAGTGDVKYHHGARGQQAFDDGSTIEVTLMPNPSHLEFVNPVVTGMARSHQLQGTTSDDVQDCHTVLPVTIHGDAAFAAEGVVAETLNMARLRGYDVGGTLHIIANNQIGFTTDPRDSRSTFYSSDLAKGYGIPIVHVNADDPEACLATVRLAMAYRARFRDDFVIDLVGYRRHGHNEGDEPAYTQPLQSRRIAEHPTVRAIYADRLLSENVVTREEVDAMRSAVLDTLRQAQDRLRGSSSGDDDGKTTAEAGAAERDSAGDAPASGGAVASRDTVDDAYEVPIEPESTGVPYEILSEINDVMVRLPEGFTPHPKLWRQFSRRAEGFSPDHTLDWGLAEALAFGSLLKEGIPIRLSGQDAQRGTFSHRHLVLHDVETGQETVPLQQVSDTRLEVYNSPLTETAILGFEYGYSVGADTDIVLWEAQFGDFVNVAQVMIDQFLSSGRAKWGQYSRLTLLLPHGYEGQGPEHSSARLERFLQLCAQDNMRVKYPTTPAQYFHLLRRQAHRRPERPLIVLTPKSLLRHPRAVSTVAELTGGRFRPVLADPTIEDRNTVERLVICSGKVYYDIQGHARRAEAPALAVARLEQLYPFRQRRSRCLWRVIPTWPRWSGRRKSRGTWAG